MNKNYLIIIILVLLVVVTAFMFTSRNDKQMENRSSDSMETSEMMEKNEMDNKQMGENMMEEGDAMEDKMMEEGDSMEDSTDTPSSDDTMMDETANEDSDSQAMTAGSYEAYSADKVARAANGDVVLFFHASWCPSCRGLDASIESNASAIPAGVTILKTDYDNSTELKQKYGVTTQHTMVQVDKDGNLIKKWSGGADLDSVVTQIQ